MTRDQQKRLWDAINEYTVSCRGNPEKYVYGNTSRMNAVVKIENIIRELEDVLPNK